MSDQRDPYGPRVARLRDRMELAKPTGDRMSPPEGHEPPRPEDTPEIIRTRRIAWIVLILLTVILWVIAIWLLSQVSFTASEAISNALIGSVEP